MFVRGVRALAVGVACAILSCAVPLAGTQPANKPPAPSEAQPATPQASALGVTSPAPTPALPPSLPPTPPLAADARLRLAGTALLNDTPVVDASVTAFDLATGKPIPLLLWTEAPAAPGGPQALRTDAQGQFDCALSRFEPGQLVKVVVSRGNQTFTAVFNDRGQAIGGDSPNSARYTLQQGQAKTVEVRLRLTAGTTGATQAFEGALKLTFQLPSNTSAERRSAVLEAARKAARALEQALAKKPEVAAHLVTSLNSAGDTVQLDTFRTAVTNLGVFTDLFRGVQAELLAISLEKLTATPDMDPIRARHFPLDDVVISSSGFLGFSGQRQPITLAGRVHSNFVPHAGRGGGGNAPALMESIPSASGSTDSDPPASGPTESGPSASPTPAWTVDSVASYVLPSTQGDNVDGIAFLRGRGKLAYSRGGGSSSDRRFRLFDVSIATNTAEPAGFNPVVSGVAQTQNAVRESVFVASVSGQSIFTYEPAAGTRTTLATSFPGAGNQLWLAAGSTRVYCVRKNNTAQTVYAYAQTGGASYPVQVEGSAWRIQKASALAVYDDGNTSPILFVGNDNGQLVSAQDGGSASRTLAVFPGGFVRGLAFATPTLFVTVTQERRVYALDVTQDPVTSVVLIAATGTAVVNYAGMATPSALALEFDVGRPRNLYIGALTPTADRQILRVQFGTLR